MSSPAEHIGTYVVVLPGFLTRQAARFTTAVTDAPALSVPLPFGVVAVFAYVATMALLLVCLIATHLVSFVFRVKIRAFRPVVAALEAVRTCGSVFGAAGAAKIDVEGDQALTELVDLLGQVADGYWRRDQSGGALPGTGPCAASDA
ncbi:hypothetical protein ACFYWY_30565 [Streptomyces sp. NPDC002870]|uniref:hypothetical protein n=1 Tax=Streptomyces sp. NPDC002870 TaxID=3364666 RepID=UPI0036A10796